MKKRILVFPVLFVLISSLQIYSQVTEEWVARYNGTENRVDNPRSISLDGSGNVYVTGFSERVGSGYDYATIKYNSSGIQQWNARYNGAGNQSNVANSIAVDNSGNVYVTGASQGSGTDNDYATIKYNASGVQQWEARYNGAENNSDAANSISVDNLGNVYVSGTSIGIGTIYDYATIKYNASGVQQWEARYNGPGDGSDYETSMAIDGLGNVFVTGWSWGTENNWDYATIKYNSSGVQQWEARYNGTGNNFDAANSISVDISGNVYVTGTSVGSGASYDYVTIKYNSSGVQQWISEYDGAGNSYSYDRALSLVVDVSGNVYVTGESEGIGTSYDYATIKYNSEGVQQWSSRYNGPGNGYDKATSLAIDSLDNVYVTGFSIGSGTSDDYATIKYNSSGVQQWIQRYNGSGNNVDVASSIIVGVSGNVYITGYSNGSVTSVDYATIKYSQLVIIQPVSNVIPKEYALFQNYPNPFNPVTNLEFGISKLGFVSLKIFDILGNEVATLVNNKLNPGTYKYEFDGSNFSSGIYFYKLEAGSFTETKRMILLK